MTEKVKPAHGWMKVAVLGQCRGVQASRRDMPGKSGSPYTPRRDAETNFVVEVADTMLPRKDFVPEFSGRPYRKPTQVGEMNILRRSREPSLRNSAKLLRNFGRRSASAGEWTLRGSRS